MSKHIYRNVIFLSLLIFSTGLYASVTVDEVVKSVKAQYEKIINDPHFKDQFLEDYEKIAQDTKNQTIHKKFQYFLESSKLIKNINPKAYNYVQDFIKNNSAQTLEAPYLFYFISESMPKVALERFYNTLKYLNEHFETKIKGYAVYRGFPDDFVNFYKRYNPEKIHNGIFKIHPIMYNFYDLNQVPAYAFAYCPKDFFRFKKCNRHLLVKGDLSVKGALDIFSREDNFLEPYYNYLIDAK